MGGPVATDEIVKLRLVVYFDGELTDDEYQAAVFTINGDVEAVQASNGAPASVWGAEGWNAVNAEDYEYSYLGWLEIAPEDIDCYNHDPDKVPRRS